MRHIVTLSLVFFSLTHLAKAERVDGLRILTERYCNKHQANIVSASVGADQSDDQGHPFFLTYNELTSIGVSFELRVPKYRAYDNVIADLIIREQPKNNSP